MTTTPDLAAPTKARLVVIDTNWVLDLCVFHDPQAEALRQALKSGQVCWLVTPGMREEFIRVLGYPAVQRHLSRTGGSADAALAWFDAHATPVPTAPPCSAKCADRDDQPFIDLAAQHHCPLLSKDREVLRLRTRLLPHGATAQNCYP